MPIVFKTEEERNPTNIQRVEEPVVEENLTQSVLSEKQECQMMSDFIMENELYQKFLLYCGVREQLAQIKLDIQE
jgi:hypothetical protein